MTFILALFMLAGFGQVAQPERAIHLEKVVKAGVDDVWKAWTTQQGIATFFAPASLIETRVDGAYEMYFAPDSPAGQRGGEGNRSWRSSPARAVV